MRRRPCCCARCAAAPAARRLLAPARAPATRASSPATARSTRSRPRTRGDPVELDRRGPRRRAAVARGPPRQAGGGRGVGLVVRAVPRRGARRRRRRRGARGRRREFVGINIRDPSPDQAQGVRRGPSTSPTRRSTPPTARRCSPSPGPCRRNSIPSFVGARRRRPGGRQHHRRAAVDDDAGRGRRGRGRGRRRRDQPMGDWFSEHGGLRLAAARHPGGAGRRAGVVLLAVRDPAAARLPLLRHRPLRRRPRAGARRGRMLAGSVLFVLGFAVVFVVARHPVRRARRLAGHVARRAHGRARRGHDRARPGLRRAGAVAPARLAGPHACRPSGWPRRRCSASCSGSAGRRASAPRSAAITTLSINEATAGRGALLSGGLRARPRPAVRRRRARLPAGARRVRRWYAATRCG